MKIKIKFTRNLSLVPFDYVSNLNGYLHKILGKGNDYHDNISLYSTSFLHGSKMSKCGKGLNFVDGAVWYVSSPSVEFINKFINSVYRNVEFAYGMELESVEIIRYELSSVDGCYRFNTKSPVLLKNVDYTTKKTTYLTCDDNIETTSKQMKNIIIKKAESYNMKIDYNDFDMLFDNNYNKRKVKWVKVKNIGNKASVCPIIIKSNNKDIVDFIYSVGVGNSTGSGFGALL